MFPSHLFTRSLTHSFCWLLFALESLSSATAFTGACATSSDCIELTQLSLWLLPTLQLQAHTQAPVVIGDGGNLPTAGNKQ